MAAALSIAIQSLLTKWLALYLHYLLANVLLRQLAVDANAAETILLRDGKLMEGKGAGK